MYSAYGKETLHGGHRVRLQNCAGDAEPKEEATQKRIVPAEAPAVSAWGRSSKLLFESQVSGGSASTGSSTTRPPAPPAFHAQVHPSAALYLEPAALLLVQQFSKKLYRVCTGCFSIHLMLQRFQTTVLPRSGGQTAHHMLPSIVHLPPLESQLAH